VCAGLRLVFRVLVLSKGKGEGEDKLWVRLRVATPGFEDFESRVQSVLSESPFPNHIITALVPGGESRHFPLLHKAIHSHIVLFFLPNILHSSFVFYSVYKLKNWICQGLPIDLAHAEA
jgi:hypothetical protein